MPDNYSNASGAVTPSVSGRQGLNVAEILERLHVLEMGDTSLPKVNHTHTAG